MFSAAVWIAWLSLGTVDHPLALPPLRVPSTPMVGQTDGRLVLRSHWMETNARSASVAALPWEASLSARSPRFRLLGGTLFATTGNGTSTTATSAGSATDTESGAGATSTASGDEATATSEDSEGTSEQEPDIELLRHRAQLTRIHRVLGITTFASVTVTTLLGTVLAINQPTLFGSGLCADIDPMTGRSRALLGEDFGCGTARTWHKVSAFVSLGLYASTGVFALSMPDPERASEGNDIRAGRLRLHRAMAWVHLAGMILQPILGIVAFEPSLVGVNIDPMDPVRSRQGLEDFQRTMRTIHLGVGYVTWAALGTAMVLELLP